MMHTLDLDHMELEQFREQLFEAIEYSGLPCEDKRVSNEPDGSIEFTMKLLNDPVLPAVPGQTCDRQRNVLLSGVLESQDTGRPAIWCEVVFSVARELSFFFPVPEEYGERVSIRFGWEFDIPSLLPRYASVRDRESVHYVSVLPSDDVQLVVETFWNVLKNWVDLEQSE